jgi:glutamate N-acetyltransferase/amino-acid N-acetyltransferase
MANETVTAAKGFLAAGVACGIKSSGRMDLGLIHCPEGATAAGVFTTNKITSASVNVCRENVRRGQIKAFVVNSGNANACTGKVGRANAMVMCKKAAKELDTDQGSVLVASTGIIGEQLPMRKVAGGISAAAEKLAGGETAGTNFAKAIMTTDTEPKQGARVFEISGEEVRIGAAVKGAGMIGPNMATTICVITTDAVISKPLLIKALKRAVGASLNRLTVDGHQSTNDTAVIMSSGQAGNKIIKSQCPRYRKFLKNLIDLSRELAEKMALGAEGATRMFQVNIEGAASRKDAAKAARAVADYDLVKCAVHGADPNWGRIICAVGSSGVRVDGTKLSCYIGDVAVFRNGQPTRFDRKKVSDIIGQEKHEITVDLGAGTCSDYCYGCDLSREYITVNADYHT